MAYWFHRNPLKATSPLTFEVRSVTSTEQTRKILNDLRTTRTKLLELLTDPNHDMHTVETATSDYISLIQGLYHVFEDTIQQQNTPKPEAETDAQKTDDAKSNEPSPSTASGNKLKSAFRYKWTNTLLGTAVTEMYDAAYEHFSMMFNVGLWYTKHAAKMAAKNDPTMEEAKEVHTCMRTAAGIFTHIKTDLIGKLQDTVVPASDTDDRILDAYINQCTAEAQEVTMARAIELQHKKSLIAALSFETGQLYKKADDALQSLDVKIVGKWRKYTELKSEFYFSYAYSYHGESLLEQDKCGEAIRCLQESVKMFTKADALCKEYAATKGAGTTARPQDHFFFRKLGPHVKRTLEKCERENGMIYHEKVPYDTPQVDLKATYGLASPIDYTPPSMSPLWTAVVLLLYHEKVPYDTPQVDLKATYGLASPIDYTPPSMSPLWTAAVYSKFDMKLHPKPEPKPQKAESIATVKEKEYPMNDKDPKNVSGCVVS